MNEQLKNSVERLLRRAEANGVAGERADRAKLEAINRKLGGIIPDWYIELLRQYPVCGLEFAWQEYPEEDDFDGRSHVFLVEAI